MQLLITRNDIARYRQISKTPNDDKLNEIILDAQLLDLQPLLGEKLFNKVINAPENYEDLLAGSIYENEGISYNNYGLKMVLAYFTHARYMMFSSITDTPFSVVEKLNNDSRPADISLKKSIYNLNREGALQLWNNVKQYIIRTNDPDFNYYKNESATGMRFSKII